MGVTTSFNLRVNGIIIKKARLRRKLVDGYPSQQMELVITPIKELGSFPINDSDIIEIHQASEPTWKRATVRELLGLFETLGIVV